MTTDFKVYKRKIDVFVNTSSNIHCGERNNLAERWTYLHSTYAYKTCKAAIAALNPSFKYKAWFAS